MLRLFVPAVAVLTLAGCTGPTPPTPPAPTSTTSRPADVPPVTDPVDLRSYYKRPCATLTAAQQDRLGFRRPVEETAGDYVAVCNWTSEDASHDYLLRLNVRFDLLVDAYETRDQRTPDGSPVWPLFEAHQVRGLPAVTHAFDTIGTHCEVIVDFGAGQGIAIAGSLSEKPDPKLCDRLLTAAGWVVDTIRRS